ncbi:MAG: 3'-5' exonuclease [Lutibacter sp.]|nr:3'-5' exonuclease [Lutibacter sp.]
MKNYLDNLNESQRAAVTHQEGPMIIIAGAGSGKTRVLTYRIAHLMAQGIDPFNILALTFTNKAAREMKNRIATVAGPEASNLWMGTFHSVFARILRAEADKLGFPSSFTIYDTQDAQRLIAAIIKERQLDKEVYKTKQVLNRISSFKNSLITVRAYQNNPELIQADRMAKRPKMGEIYAEYVNRCFKAGAMDFDDLLLRTNELLTRFPAVLYKYQDRFRYILVDEYQDTNHSQYLIVRALADRFQNICVVGDDSQSIYGFRGANIQNILHFQRDYDQAAIFKLEQNYRSTGNIVRAANSIISRNETKLDKEVWTQNAAGGKIKIMRTYTEADEGRFLANSIFDNRMNQQIKYSDFAVLYRTNAQSRAIEDALRKKNIQYKIYGGLSFYQRKEIKDILAYLRLLINPQDEEAFKRVINYPMRGIGATTLDKLFVAANHYQKPVFDLISSLDEIDIKLNAGTRTKITDFVTMIRHFQIVASEKNAFEVAELVVKKTRILADLEKDGTPESVSRVENVQELLNGIKDFIEVQTTKDREASLAVFLEDVALATDFDLEKEDSSPRVSLMTIHLAKGLEFPYVYIVGLEENLFPSAMSMNTRSELEEERRLFYVALTRAEKQAYLSHAQTRYRWGKLIDCEPSRFLEEIDEQYTEHLSPARQPAQGNQFVDKSLFSQTPPDKIRFKKPLRRGPEKKASPPKKPPFVPPRNLTRVSQASGTSDQLLDSNLSVGMAVSHRKFGRGRVLSITGSAANRKAEIEFNTVGVKKLLLQFAKLTIIG